ncbi:MAG: hypothetical protein MZV70_60005 [Desulfobacterales bacterium]|nr:hypothetical protein [Desulfobacterales bacterium]
MRQEVKKVAQGDVSGFLNGGGQNAIRVRRGSMPWQADGKGLNRQCGFF